MMLTELPAIPTLPGSMDRTALVDHFPVFSFSSHLKPTFPLLLTLLASLVIIASIRAALLFLRPLSSKNAQIIPVIIPGQEKSPTLTTTLSASSSSSSSSSLSKVTSKTIIVPSSSTCIPPPPPSPGSSEAQKPQTRRRWSSWGWGLVKWDTLPALPAYNGGTGNRNSSRTRWEQHELQRQQEQRPIIQQHRPQFESHLPALYQSEAPVSMAKMIMSRHTFRRPSSRPPPVRNSNAPQYQRKLPSMV